MRSVLSSRVLLDVGEEKPRNETRWVSQKDHLSCVRGSVEREGDSDGAWLLLLLSSPLKLFLHTGHVSCCVATEQKIDDISFGQF